MFSQTGMYTGEAGRVASDMVSEFGYDRCSRTLLGVNYAFLLLMLAAVGSTTPSVQTVAIHVTAATSWSSHVGPWRAPGVPVLSTFLLGLANVTAAEPPCREPTLAAIGAGADIKCQVHAAGDTQWVIGRASLGMVSSSSSPLPASIGPLWAHVGPRSGEPALNSPLDSVSGNALIGVGANLLL